MNKQNETIIRPELPFGDEVGGVEANALTTEWEDPAPMTEKRKAGEFTP